MKVSVTLFVLVVIISVVAAAASSNSKQDKKHKQVKKNHGQLRKYQKKDGGGDDDCSEVCSACESQYGLPCTICYGDIGWDTPQSVTEADDSQYQAKKRLFKKSKQSKRYYDDGCSGYQNCCDCYDYDGDSYGTTDQDDGTQPPSTDFTPVDAANANKRKSKHHSILKKTQHH